MEKIILTKALKIKDNEVQEVTLDFNELTGKDFIEAEKKVRALGDQSPSVFLSLRYQAAIAAKLIGVKIDDVMEMNADDFKKIVVPVATFLLS